MKRKTAKELLAESFRELAQSWEIDRITVQDIAKNCGYSIATFYRQIKDKYVLIAWDYARDVQKLLDQEDGTPKDWRQSFSDATDYYDEQRKYLANLLTNTSGYDSFIRYMTEIHFSALMNRICRSGHPAVVVIQFLYQHSQEARYADFQQIHHRGTRDHMHRGL